MAKTIVVHSRSRHPRANPADYPPEYDQYEVCGVCSKYVDDCICPECPTCGEQGNPACYGAGSRGHGLTRSRAQEIAHTEGLIAQLQQQIDAHRAYIGHLESESAGEEYTNWRRGRR